MSGQGTPRQPVGVTKLLKQIPQQYPEYPIYRNRIEPTVTVDIVRQITNYMNRSVQFIVIRSRLQHDFYGWSLQ